jgi:hypothetical protein
MASGQPAGRGILPIPEPKPDGCNSTPVDDHDHFIGPEERFKLAMARQ